MNSVLGKVLFCVLLAHATLSYKTATKKFTDILTLTYVYGDESAMLSHEEAMSFCRDLSSTHKLKSLNSTSSGKTTTLKPSKTQEKSTSDEDYLVKSDLLSLHDPTMTRDLMKWIKSVDSHQFWIGGMVKLVVDEFSHGREHLIQLWTDRTPANFRYIQYPNNELVHLRPNAVRCLSVDYSSGKWGVHPCIDKMYFVCETVKLPKKDLGIKETSKKTVLSSKTIKKGNTTLKKKTLKTIKN